MDKEFSERNRRRCEAATGFNHSLGSWNASDWMVAFVGEVGEAANIVKKLNRYRDSVPGNKESREALKEKLADELADSYIYLDLFCQSEGIDLRSSVEKVFQRKSAEIGYVE